MSAAPSVLDAVIADELLADDAVRQRVRGVDQAGVPPAGEGGQELEGFARSISVSAAAASPRANMTCATSL
jgi:hypothetical protein